MPAVVIPVALVLALAGFLLVRAIRQGGDAKVEVAAFLTDLEGGQYGDAYGRLCPATRQAFPLQRFEAEMALRKPIGFQMTGELRVSKSFRGATSTVGVRVRFADGKSEGRLVPLRRRRGAGWQICGSPY